MSILKNSINSIQMGVEDYASDDERRILSSARNLFAGILLLFKHKLSQLSPDGADEVLIKQKILPVFEEGGVSWVGKGKKTVDVQNIQERFNSLGISVDWDRVKNINNYRNDIEHYYSNATHEAAQLLITDSFIVIRDFISQHLQEDPKDMLGDSTWSILIETSEVYERERKICHSALKTLEYFDKAVFESIKTFSCSRCGFDLCKPNDENMDATEANFICRSCDANFSYESVIEKCIPNYYYSGDLHRFISQGGELPITDCPECGGIYLYNEKVCASCGFEATHICVRCSAVIAPEELLVAPLCGYCSHVVNKDD